ncbi:hypothetical protein F4780DRAFT_713665 [Xylariomycetidae sp. FL0641]|nr:hypothetical protein F4780DRAFT_713665 [Xylariomycetidae sp. FL0641]
MASNAEAKMDSPEAKTSATSGRLEGSVSNADEAKLARTDDTAAASNTTPAAEASKNGNGQKKGKKTAGKQHAKSKKAKPGKSQKRTVEQPSSSSSDTDSEPGTTDSDSDDNAADTAVVLSSNSKKSEFRKGKRVAKKASKQSSSSKAKKSKKASTGDSTSDSDAKDKDDSDSDTDEEDDSPRSNKGEMLKMQRQIETLHQTVATLTTAMTSLNSSHQPGTAVAAGIPGHNAFANLGGNAVFGGPQSLYGLPPDQLARMMTSAGRGGRGGRGGHRIVPARRLPPGDDDLLSDDELDDVGGNSRSKGRKDSKSVVQKNDYRRVDQVWDSQLHNYKLQDTAETAGDSQHSEYLFHVRRTFDWEGKFKSTIVDIKSKQLREALQDIIGNIKGVSLVDDVPKLDPNILFLYLEEMREHKKFLNELEPEAETRKERKKIQKWIDEKRRHLKVLIKYLDKDYAQTKKSLYPMLENGLITFDLLWALWKPNTLAYTTTYGSPDEPRAFKVEIAEKHFSVFKGEFYYIEGKYFEYDGKQFGFGSVAEEIAEFRGARKITTLNCYPLKYHHKEAELRQTLIERGKKFVSLGGVHYKSHTGLAYTKKKKAVIKVNINGRIMVDPAIHRRINPNYPVSLVRPKDHDLISDPEDSDEEDGCGCGDDSDDDEAGAGNSLLPADEQVKCKTKYFKDDKGNIQMARIPKSMLNEEKPEEKLDKIPDKDGEGDEKATDEAEPQPNGDDKSDKSEVPEYSDEEYLIASPVVLGFAFPEKLWLEFTVSGIKEISWNDHAYASLVIKPQTKEIVQALVESHKYHPAESIDDVIQGKGKGLVTVLHGPPGTGKTLTAEGISELLKCPLYMVSAGDLGTDSRYLEAELQKILDICHAWGAILLLDEADVFLEKRNLQDIHRNALVSIFLRQLEYFQGILFLTTNRVQTFDDAFQSRIHLALPYAELDLKAKKAVFKIFIKRVQDMATASSNGTSKPRDAKGAAAATIMNGDGRESNKKVQNCDTRLVEEFTEDDYSELARHELNGRQIKNTVTTAQALAVNRHEPLAMRHVRQVLEVQRNFDYDLKGNNPESMHHYS